MPWKRFHQSGQSHFGSAIVVVIVFTCFLAGCGSRTIWSATAVSADGNWVAVARTAEYSGFGTGAVETTVDVREKSGWVKRSTRVLGFKNDGRSLDLKMTWITPAHLEVEFNGSPNMLYYQVVRASGIEISVHDVALPAK
ncbi:MAG TPA: hypothetical protein VFU27_01420 [Terriglobales bacterium]|nr:hypothetical protein [Terriglobales bacterium]